MVQAFRFLWKRMLIVPSHIHLLFQAENQNPSDLIRDFKTFLPPK